MNIRREVSNVGKFFFLKFVVSFWRKVAEVGITHWRVLDLCDIGEMAEGWSTLKTICLHSSHHGHIISLVGGPTSPPDSRVNNSQLFINKSD